MKRDPVMMALDAIKGDARKAKVARALPEGQRPKGFMISIGMMPDHEAEESIVGPSDEREENDESEGY